MRPMMRERDSPHPSATPKPVPTSFSSLVIGRRRTIRALKFSGFMVRPARESLPLQTLCQDLTAEDRPVASFFFKRGDFSRGNGMKLFPTVAYQLARLAPEFRAAVVDCVDDAPDIFDKSLYTQLGALILESWHQLPVNHAAVVVIDGLDECTGEKRQQEIVRSIAQGLVGNSTSLRFLIASRPEPHIAELFQEPNLQNTHRQMNIAPSFTDIHTYLRDEFGRISRDHKMMMGVQTPWPDQRVLEYLIERSSGYFIYAATVIKFIDDPDFRPTRQLSIIMGMAKPKHGSPYAALDQLYTQILEQVPDSSQLLRILAVLAADHALPMFKIEQLLGLESDDVWLTLLFLSACHQTRIHDLHPAVTLQYLAQGGMRAMIKLTTNRLPQEFYAAAPLWGSVLRACPPDPELLETLIETEQSSTISDPDRPWNKSNVHNAIEWLKTFPDPPRKLIERIQELLPDSDSFRDEFADLDVEDFWLAWKERTGW